MGRKRYLLYFSYIGKQFSGLQRQIPRDRPNNMDVATVQGIIEYGLSRLKPNNEPLLYPSSRTDQGVHALRTSAHVDLEFNYDITTSKVTQGLNSFFSQTGVDIRILNTVEVSPFFNARRLPKWRQYLYRFAVLKTTNHTIEDGKFSKFFVPMPITEAYRCHFVLDPTWKVDAAQEACPFFVGSKNYLTFMAKSRGCPEDIDTNRIIFSFEMFPGRSMLSTQLDEDWVYWNVRVRGKSFLYKQVRRMVSSLIAVGGRKITTSDIVYMLENPSQSNWISSISTIPGHGLYLEDIHYDPEDYNITEAEVQAIRESSEDFE